MPELSLDRCISLRSTLSFPNADKLLDALFESANAQSQTSLDVQETIQTHTHNVFSTQLPAGSRKSHSSFCNTASKSTAQLWLKAAGYPKYRSPPFAAIWKARCWLQAWAGPVTEESIPWCGNVLLLCVAGRQAAPWIGKEHATCSCSRTDPQGWRLCCLDSFQPWEEICLIKDQNRQSLF